MKSRSYFARSFGAIVVAAICVLPCMAHAADLSIVKSGQAAPLQNSVVTFTLTASTNGTLGLPNGVVVTVTDTLPIQFNSIVVLSSPTWGCNVVGQVVTCTRNTAIAGNSAYPVISIAAVAHTTGSYHNCASISYVPVATTPADPNLANNTNCVNGTIAAGVAHDVSITKTVVPGPFSVGGYVQFTLHPVNSGPGTLSVGSGDVSITDIIPAGFSFAGWSSPSGWTCPSPAVGTPGPVAIVCNYAGPTVAAGNALGTINIAFAAHSAGSFQNCANITYNHPPGDSWPANNQGCVPFVVGTPPVAHDVNISKTVSGTGPYPVGSSVQFTLHPGNSGPGTLTVGNGDVTVTDTVPAGFTFQGWSGTGWNCPTPAVNTVSPFTITCNYIGATVGAGNALVPINIALKANTAGSFQNCTSIAYNHAPGDSWPANNNACIPFVVGPNTTPVAHDVNISKTVSGTGPYPVGSSVQFTLHPGNSGPGTLTIGSGDVTVTDTVPAGFTFQGWSGTGWSCPTPAVNTNSPFTITCNYIGATVGAGNALVPINIALKANTAGSFQNCTSIAYNHAPGDSWPANNNACVPFVVGTTTPVAHDVYVNKTVGSGPFSVGSNVMFTLHPGNSGPGALTIGPSDVTVTDTVPAGFTYVSAVGVGPGWACTPSGTVGPFIITCTYSGPVVTAGNPLNVINVTLQATTSGTLQNCSDISYNHAPGDTWMGNNHSCVPVTVGTTSTWPTSATVNTYNTGMPFGPQLVNIASGGSVTFDNVDASGGWTVQCVSAPIPTPCFAPFPLSGVAGSTATTIPGTFPTPGTYVYHIVGYFINGTIIVH